MTSPTELPTSPSAKSLTKVLIVEDHPLVREGLALRIAMRPDWTVCGEAETIQEALQKIEETRPDLALVDISLGDGNGIDLIREINARFPRTKILVISGYHESLYAERALRAGAHGYINKQEPIHRLMAAIEAVLKGDHFVSSDVSRRLFAKALGAQPEPDSPVTKLTPRELEIFRLIGEGMTSGAIARKLFLSSHTIDTHRENIKRKIGAQNAAELSRQAVVWVMENG